MIFQMVELYHNDGTKEVMLNVGPTKFLTTVVVFNIIVISLIIYGKLGNPSSTWFSVFILLGLVTP